jgi:hypothetical protein
MTEPARVLAIVIPSPQAVSLSPGNSASGHVQEVPPGRLPELEAGTFLRWVKYNPSLLSSLRCVSGYQPGRRAANARTANGARLPCRACEAKCLTMFHPSMETPSGLPPRFLLAALSRTTVLCTWLTKPGCGNHPASRSPSPIIDSRLPVSHVARPCYRSGHRRMSQAPARA